MDGKLIGVYARGNSIQIKFSYKGIRCAETLKRLPTKRNLKNASNLRGEILRHIELGNFNYTDYFPNSRKARQFSNKNLKIILNLKDVKVLLSIVALTNIEKILIHT